MSTGIDLPGLVKAVDYLEAKLKRRLPGRMATVLRAQQEKSGGMPGERAND